ncbi:MAG: hypothetical protein AB8U44_04380, partial [Aaplasma endosymbiont of Hyalomma asiaticum]
MGEVRNLTTRIFYDLRDFTKHLVVQETRASTKAHPSRSLGRAHWIYVVRLLAIRAKSRGSAKEGR